MVVDEQTVLQQKFVINSHRYGGNYLNAPFYYCC